MIRVISYLAFQTGFTTIQIQDSFTEQSGTWDTEDRYIIRDTHSPIVECRVRLETNLIGNNLSQRESSFSILSRLHKFLCFFHLYKKT